MSDHQGDRTREHVELIREGNLLAEVRVRRIYDDDPQRGWGPYYSMDDALRLERVGNALRAGDLPAAARDARIYRVMPAA